MRKLVWLVSLALVLASSLLVLGFVLPSMFVDDGVGQLRDQVRAEEALLEARSACLENPIARLLIRRVRIVELRRGKEGARPHAAFSARPCYPPRYRSKAHRAGHNAFSRKRDYYATLRVYTLFGIDKGTISVRPGGSISCPHL